MADLISQSLDSAQRRTRTDRTDRTDRYLRVRAQSLAPLWIVRRPACNSLGWEFLMWAEAGGAAWLSWSSDPRLAARFNNATATRIARRLNATTTTIDAPCI